MFVEVHIESSSKNSKSSTRNVITTNNGNIIPVNGNDSESAINIEQEKSKYIHQPINDNESEDEIFIKYDDLVRKDNEHEILALVDEKSHKVLSDEVDLADTVTPKSIWKNAFKGCTLGSYRSDVFNPTVRRQIVNANRQLLPKLIEYFRYSRRRIRKRKSRKTTFLKVKDNVIASMERRTPEMSVCSDRTETSTYDHQSNGIPSNSSLMNDNCELTSKSVCSPGIYKCSTHSKLLGNKDALLSHAQGRNSGINDQMQIKERVIEGSSFICRIIPKAFVFRVERKTPCRNRKRKLIETVTITEENIPIEIQTIDNYQSVSVSSEKVISRIEPVPTSVNHSDVANLPSSGLNGEKDVCEATSMPSKNSCYSKPDENSSRGFDISNRSQGVKILH